jgi:D-arginine dehydrogenase
VIEAEPALSYHASGRSAALYTECYGPGVIPLLTKASKAFFTDRDDPLASARGMLFVAAGNQTVEADRLFERFSATVDDLRRLDHTACRDLLPVLEPTESWTGIYEPGAMDLDINGLEAVYRSTIRDHGGDILIGARVTDIRREPSRTSWELITSRIPIEADIVVDAAGAWGDTVASMAGVVPLGLTPLRRSAFLTADVSGSGSWPMVVDIDETWYMKPEGPNLLCSPADEIPSDPVDARPEEIDIARGIDRINAATTIAIRHVSSAWAGLRTFTPDRLPAVGFDPSAPAFFWLVGQGGYGVKTSPAMAEYAAGLILHGGVPDRLAAAGITESALSPARFR